MLRKRVVVFLMIIAVVATLLSGCNSKPAGNGGSAAPTTAAPTDDPILTGAKPTLKFLMQPMNFDVNADPVAKKVEEVTGYKVEYHVLPSENADQKLVLDLTSGVDYDIVRLTPAQFSLISSKNVLKDIGSIIDKYAPETKKVVSEYGWKSSTVDGKIVGIPIESGTTPDNPMDPVTGGILFRKDLLDKAGKKVPTNAAELKDVLKAFKDMGLIPLVAAPTSAILPSIESAFDVPTTNWKLVGDKIMHRIELPQTRQYVEYLASLSKDGLLDPEYAVSKADTIKTKFVSGKAGAIVCYFWDVPNLEPALKQQIPTASVTMNQPLKDENGKMHIGLGKGVDYYEVVPKSAKNAEHAMVFQNEKSKEDNYVQIYLGTEGKTFEVKNGNYYPILPAFNDWNNASHYVGAIEGYKSRMMWGARARKTPEMAVVYETMNANLPKDSFYVDVTKFAANLPSLNSNISKFVQTERDTMTAIIAGTKTMADWDEFVKTFKAQAGDTMTKDINEWYNTVGKNIK